MLRLWVYSSLVGILLAVAGLLLEWVVSHARRPRRWVWMTGLALTLCVGFGAWWAPSAWRVELGSTWVVRLPVVAAIADQDRPSGRPGLQQIDRALPWVWAIASALLVVTYLGGRWALRRRRLTWRWTRVLDVSVLVAPDEGPAVLGILEPSIVIPEWALALDGGSLEMILAHEREHQRARDPLALHLAAFALLAMPWNPACWWMFARLRQAVELDCDARVLAPASASRAAEYGALLVRIATRTPVHRSAVAPAILRHPSNLARRISAMSPTPMKPFGARAALSLCAALTLVIVALLIPAPRLHASVASSGQASSQLEDPFVPGGDVSRPKPIKEVHARYTREAMDQKIQGEVHLAAVIGRDGIVERVRVTKSLDTEYGLDEAAVAAASQWTFEPAKKNGQPVPVRVEMVMAFRLK